MQIKLSAFGGEIPRVQKRLIPDTQAQTAINCDFLAGSIKNVSSDLPIDSVSLAATTQSIFNYNWNNVDNWLQWTADVDVVKSPIVGDKYNRIYYTGNGAPRMRSVNVRDSEKFYIGSVVIVWSKTDTRLFIAQTFTYPPRANSTAYTLTSQVVWANTSLTYWRVSSLTGAGVSAATPPSIVGIAVGGTVVDGQVTWIRIATPTSGYAGTPGRTAATAPDVSAVQLGQSILDGSVTWTACPTTSTPTRQPSYSYGVGQAVKWSTGTTYWKCIVAGISAATPPSITGIDYGLSVVDGSVVWTRIFDNTSPEFDTLLGVPKPTGKVTVNPVSKTTTSWTATWTGWWEEPDGTKKGEQVYPYVIPGGRTYYPPYGAPEGTKYILTQTSGGGNNILPKPTGTSDAAKFILMLQASSSSGKLLGRVFPDISFYASSSDLYINGAKVTATSTLVTTTLTDIIVTLSYDTTATSEYIADRAYIYTFVDGLGEEGPPSDPSDIKSIGPNEDAELSGMNESGATGYQPIYLKRIYRLVTTTAGTNYQFVKEIDIQALDWDKNRAYRVGEVVLCRVIDGVDYLGKYYQCLLANTNTKPTVGASSTNWFLLNDKVQFQDNMSDDETGEVVPSIGWDPPGANYTGLVYLPGEFFAAFDDKTVYFSEPRYPHAWPVSYGVTVEDEIVGLGVAENTVAILTNKFPYLCTVQAPDQAYVSKLSAPQSCVAKRSIVESGGAIIYASQDGICVIANASVVVSTLALFTKDQWFTYRSDATTQVLDDTKTQCFINDQYVYVNTLNKAFRFRIGDNTIALVEMSEHFYGYFVDRVIDDLYIIKQTADFGRAMYKLGEGTSHLASTWQSKEFVLPLPQKWMIGRVTSTAYPVTMEIYTDGVTSALASMTVTDNKAFRLPYLGRYKFWSIRAAIRESFTSTEITEILLSTNFSDL